MSSDPDVQRSQKRMRTDDGKGGGALLVPARPAPLVSVSKGIPEDELQAMRTQLEAEAAVREGLLPRARECAATAERAVSCLHCGQYEEAAVIVEQASAALVPLLASVQELTNATYVRGHPVMCAAVEKVALAQSLSSFLTAGRLPAMAAMPYAPRAEEFLLSLTSVCHELNRYAIGRASVGDVRSVALCGGVVAELFRHFLKFDFRNGELRRRYDSVKYCVRRMEDILYELSLTGATPEGVPKDAGAAALGEDVEADMERVRAEIEAYDARRELVIKGTRDVQKAAKQAIFSLHRGDTAGAGKKLKDAHDAALAIKRDHLDELPTLRQGSYAAAMEELAEARLFEAWLLDGTLAPPSHAAFAGLAMEPIEYLGALVDLTGEVGRSAVQAAGQRDEEAVRRALATDLAVQRLWMGVGDKPGKLGKKEGELQQNIKKLERVLYELSLLKATGRKVQTSAGDDPAPANGGGDED